MAQKLTAQTAQAAHGADEATAFSNSANRANIIRNAKIELDRHENQIELLKRAIAAEKSGMKDIYQMLSDDLKLTRKRFETATELIALPEEEQNKAIDEITEVWEALMRNRKLNLTGAPDEKPLGPESARPPAVAIGVRVDPMVLPPTDVVIAPAPILIEVEFDFTAAKENTGSVQIRRDDVVVVVTCNGEPLKAGDLKAGDVVTIEWPGGEIKSIRPRTPEDEGDFTL